MQGKRALRSMVFVVFMLPLLSAAGSDLGAEGTAPCAAWLTAAEVQANRDEPADQKTRRPPRVRE
jgi:hypothetical protein